VTTLCISRHHCSFHNWAVFQQLLTAWLELSRCFADAWPRSRVGESCAGSSGSAANDHRILHNCLQSSSVFSCRCRNFLENAVSPSVRAPTRLSLRLTKQGVTTHSAMAVVQLLMEISNATLACNGNKAEICGGPLRLNLFSYLTCNSTSIGPKYVNFKVVISDQSPARALTVLFCPSRDDS